MVTAYALVVPGLALVVSIDPAMTPAVFVAPGLAASDAHHLVVAISAVDKARQKERFRS